MSNRAVTRGKWVSLLIAVPIVIASCGQEPQDDPQPDMDLARQLGPPFSLTLAEVGFSTPESALHDPEADVYLVANINGAPAEQDGNGFISRISPTGAILELSWIDGSLPGVTLNAPKGMAIVADTLFVTDINCVRRFHRVTGAPLQDLCLEEATFLNDLAATPRGDLYFSDSGTGQSPGAVYFLRHTADVPQKVVLADGTVLEGEALGGPNGVFADRRGLYVATYGSGELFRVTLEGERLQLLYPSEMGLDGLVSLEDRGFLLSSWGDSTVYWIHSDGTVTSLIENVEAPADIGYDAIRNRVLIPLFRANELILLEVR
jgi:sugar lactone lactonase YvrE